MTKKIILPIAFITMFNISSYAAKFNDIQNHWAETTVEKWADLGIIYGSDGYFYPDVEITRAEMCALISRIFNASYSPDVSFGDVNKQNWYYNDIMNAVGMGIIQSDKGDMAPEVPISRQEAAQMLVKMFSFKGMDNGNIEVFPDYIKIDDWAKRAFSTVITGGYMRGGTDGMLRPNEPMSRAEAAIVFDRIVKSLAINGNFLLTGDVKGNAVVRFPETSIENADILGNLYVADGVGEGELTIKSSSVSGDVFIRGGGSNSVIFDSSDLNGDINIVKPFGTVRVVVENGTNVAGYVRPYIASTIVTVDSETKVEIPTDLPEKSDVTIIGNFSEILVNSKNVNIHLKQSVVENLIITAQSSSNNIELDTNTLIRQCVVNEKTNILGDGRIETATINAPNVVISKTPENLVTAPGVSVEIADSNSVGGTSISGGSKPHVAVESVNIDISDGQKSMIIGDTLQLNAIIMPENAKDKAVTWESGDRSIAQVNETGIVTAKSIGSVVITASAGGKTGDCVLQVLPAPWDGATRSYDWYTSAMDGRYEIRTPDELAGMSDIVSGLAVGIEQDDFHGDMITLQNDIDLGDKDWPLINGVFSGVFDGRDKTIRNLKFTGEAKEYSGLFKKVQDGELKNMVISDADIKSAGYTGILSGYIGNSKISNCIVSGSITGEGYEAVVAGITEYAKNSIITGCINNADINVKNGDGGIYSAGIVCEMSGSMVENSINNGAVNTSYSLEPTNNLYTYAGGIATYLKNGSTVTGCVNNGGITVTGGGYGSAGGIAGLIWQEGKGCEKISDCVNNGIVSASAQDAYSGGIVSEVYADESHIQTVNNCFNSALVIINSGLSDITGYVPALGTVIGWCSNAAYIIVSGNSSTGSVSASGRDYESNGLYGNFFDMSEF